MPNAPAYMDCASTTLLDPRVRQGILRYLDEDFGNAGSRTNGYDGRAKSAVERARAQASSVVQASLGEIVFTRGATESNNLAILGLAWYGAALGRPHIVSTVIERSWS